MHNVCILVSQLELTAGMQSGDGERAVDNAQVRWKASIALSRVRENGNGKFEAIFRWQTVWLEQFAFNSRRVNVDQWTQCSPLSDGIVGGFGKCVF